MNEGEADRQEVRVEIQGVSVMNVKVECVGEENREGRKEGRREEGGC